MKLRWMAVPAVACLVGGCTWTGDDWTDRNPEHQPGYYSASSPTAGGHTARGGGDVNTIDLVNGADVVRVRMSNLGSDRYAVSTPDNAKVAPSVSTTGHEVIVGLHDSGDGGGPAVVTILLSPAVRWQITLAGGASDEAVDLSGGPGGDVDFSAGVSTAAVTLPAGKGTQRVVLSGGASQFGVRLNDDAPARVSATGGAGSVTIDGETHSGVAGGSVWTPSNWAAATNRYDIDATSGVSTLTVSRS